MAESLDFTLAMKQQELLALLDVDGGLDPRRAWDIRVAVARIGELRGALKRLEEAENG